MGSSNNRQILLQIYWKGWMQNRVCIKILVCGWCCIFWKLFYNFLHFYFYFDRDNIHNFIIYSKFLHVFLIFLYISIYFLRFQFIFNFLKLLSYNFILFYFLWCTFANSSFTLFFYFPQPFDPIFFFWS